MNNKLHFNIMLIVTLSFTLLASFCKKTETGVFTADAKVYDSGSVAVDGCGWFLRVDSTKEYSPIKLDEDFKVSGLKVTVLYRLLKTDFTCGWGAKLRQIEILDIKRKDPIPLPVEATIINAGLPEADGCGWLVKVDTSHYSPTNLPEKYKQSDLKVKLAFDKLNSKFQCGIAANKLYYRITIRDIQPK